MNDTQQKAAAIERKVREVCPELTERYCTSGVGCTHDNEGGHEGSCVWKYVYGEIHLEHLLRTVYSTMGEMTSNDGRKQASFLGFISYNVTPDGGVVEPLYNLTKSFSENLENNELTDFLYKLICE